MMRKHDGREPESILPRSLPSPVTFEPNKEFLRNLLATQVDLTTLGTGYVRDAHERFQRMQERVHDAQKAPSEVVIDRHREMFGREYRLQTDGEHPVESLREARVKS